jgi:rubredoxin-NAD+ reductase
MTSRKPLVVVGTGLGGYTLAREFRRADADTPLVLVTGDDGRFYSKPMLSNGFAKDKDADSLAISDARKMASDLDARILVRTMVTEVDAAAGVVRAGEETIAYGNLVLAVGAVPIMPPMEGDAVAEVLQVNNLLDYARFRAAVEGRRNIAVIGPGLIGCEFANDLIKAGFSVTVIGPDHWPLSTLLPEEGGKALRAALAELGVTWRLETIAQRVERDDGRLRLDLSTGDSVRADAVLSAIGLRPNVRLARETGLDCNRGIVVDRHFRTSADKVYAIGDCVEVDGLVLPFVMPITHASRALAKTLSGEPTPVTFPAMPVVVKTPAHPIVVSPPRRGADGEWEVEVRDDGVKALFRGTDGALLGFALTGSAKEEWQRLAKELPGVLG